MADNTLLSASTGTGDTIRTVHKTTNVKWPVSLIDVGGTSTGTESILGDSTHAMPVSIRAGSTTLTVTGTSVISGTVAISGISGTTPQAVTVTTASTLSVNVSNTVTITGTSPTAVPGSPSTGVMSIQGVSSGVGVNVSGSTINVNVVSVSGTTTVSVSGSTVSLTATGVPGTASTNVLSVQGVSSGVALPLITGQTGIQGGTGATSANTVRVSVATDDTWVGNISNLNSAVQTDDAAVTLGLHKVHIIGHVADETATDSVDEGDIGIPRMTLDRKTIVTPYAHTAGGATPYTFVGTTVIQTTSIKTTPGTVYAVQAFNKAITPFYLKLYDTTAAPTTSNTAVQRYLVPCSTVTGGAGVVCATFPIEMTSGIGYRMTGGSILDSDTVIAGTTSADWWINVVYE